jgi:hypothetical protein
MEVLDTLQQITLMVNNIMPFLHEVPQSTVVQTRKQSFTAKVECCKIRPAEYYILVTRRRFPSFSYYA